MPGEEQHEHVVRVRPVGSRRDGSKELRPGRIGAKPQFDLSSTEPPGGATESQEGVGQAAGVLGRAGQIPERVPGTRCAFTLLGVVVDPNHDCPDVACDGRARVGHRPAVLGPTPGRVEGQHGNLVLPSAEYTGRDRQCLLEELSVVSRPDLVAVVVHPQLDSIGQEIRIVPPRPDSDGQGKPVHSNNRLRQREPNRRWFKLRE